MEKMNSFNSWSSIINFNGYIEVILPIYSPITDGLIFYADFSDNVIISGLWKNLVTNTAYGTKNVTYMNPGYRIGSTSTSGYLGITMNNSVQVETLFFVINIPLSGTSGSVLYLQSCNDQLRGPADGRYFAIFRSGSAYYLSTSTNYAADIRSSNTFNLLYDTKYLITITRASNLSCPLSRLNGKTIGGSQFNMPTTMNTVNPNLGNYIGVRNIGQNGASLYIPYILYEFEIYNSNLTLTQIKQMEQYLINKWSIDPNII